MLDSLYVFVVVYQIPIYVFEVLVYIKRMNGWITERVFIKEGTLASLTALIHAYAR